MEHLSSEIAVICIYSHSLVHKLFAGRGGLQCGMFDTGFDKCRAVFSGHVAIFSC